MKSSKSWLIYKGGSGLQIGLMKRWHVQVASFNLLLRGCPLSGKSRTSRRTNWPFPEYMHSSLYLVRNRTLGPPLENNAEIPPSSRDEGLRLLHGLATNLATSLQTPQEA